MVTTSRRHKGPVISDDDDDVDIKQDEVNNFDEDDEDSPPSENDKNEDDYIEEDDEMPRTRRRTIRSKRIMKQDSDFDDDDNNLDDDDEEISEDDKYFERLKEKQFIATDDEDDGGNYGYGSRRRRMKRRSRSRSLEPRKRTRRTRNNSDSEDGDNEEPQTEVEEDIQKEIAELYDSSPEPGPVKHKLRERAKIDYTIPPPITTDAQLERQATATPSFTKGKRGRPSTANKSEYRNLLFPTAGPFGGSDVISLFGTNIPPGGIPIPGLSNNGNPAAIGNNLSDSDSSDDEITPINGSATITKKPFDKVKKINNTKLIGTSATGDKKKNNLSDTDPLGVDMNIDFDSVGGLDNYINQLKEMVALPLLYPELYQNFSITPPRGVLFHGPPGTGKTLMARALAASCSTSTRKITFFMRKGADCLSKWVGEAERQLRLLFEEAKNQQPSIIFFDEIDGLAPVRSSKQEQIHASIVSTLLALMDGMDNRGQVIVIGATNRPDSVDPALRRPGRFDREFYFPLPDANSRKQILKIHTKKWVPPLKDEFVEKIADLTKGYGGADLRALCTEAALSSIQRKYPQIYFTNEKLKVHPSKVRVIAKDFMNAVEKIVPSSARSTSSRSSPLPSNLKCLLENSLNEITLKLNNLIPNSIHTKNNKKSTKLDEALYLDPTTKDEDGGFGRQELLKNLENSRICKPHLLICGDHGNGQQYLGSAILNYLEGFQVQSLDIGSMFEDPTRTPESTIVQAFIEARRHQPSIVFIPNIDIWYNVVPYSAKATLTSLLRSLKSNEKILLLGISETNMEQLDPEIKLIFGLNNEGNNVSLRNPKVDERKEFFKSLESTLLMKPFEFINDLENRPKRKLKTLEVVKQDVTNNEDLSKKALKQQEYQDTKLKNTLKIKLASLMDLFKVRYKRFKKPIIDENYLTHLFYPEILENQNPLIPYEVLYEKATDKEHENMIRELKTGKYYHNIDLDIIEERLWNGYYSEPKQFLRDIKMIVQDSITDGDRDRVLKSNEMLTNAQFGIDDISTPEFIQACKDMRKRELERQAKVLQEHKELQEKIKKGEIVLDQQQPAIEFGGVIGEVNGSIENGQSKAIEDIEMAEEPKIVEDVVMSEPKEAAQSEGDEMIPQIEGQIQTQALLEPNGSVVDANGVPIIGDDVDESLPAIDKPVEIPLNGTKETETEITAKQTEIVEESESEPEEEVSIDYSKPLIIPETYKHFFDQRVIEITEHCNIEKLEIIMARLMDIIWSDRNKWDKTETVEKLYEVSKEIETDLKI
ncbi:tat-binding homolog 7 [[Candida] jaroonii]|uniref:Tat-binding homolog 7 n=1 Tax=[Candida] jaroonii TaxID=467808 RepID=A0ACA9YFL2_9ASCO|nr:tat-binding homolog 7 [[Candida] jaroonii]